MENSIQNSQTAAKMNSFLNSTVDSARRQAKPKATLVSTQGANIVKGGSTKKATNAFLTYSNKKMRDFLQLSKKKSVTVKASSGNLPATINRQISHQHHKIKSFTSTGSTASSSSSSSSSSSTGSSVCYTEAASFKSKLKRKLFAKSSMVNI
jgi:hypothetical protein